MELRVRLRNLKRGRAELVKVEEEVRAALDGVGREIMAEVFATADIDEPEVLVNGELHGRVDRRSVTIHTTFGAVQDVEQTIYGRGRGFPKVAPMEKLLGLVETFYTPKCAKVLCHVAAVTVREEGEELLRELGGIGVGSATMHRLPLAVMARYERDRDIIEPVVRERSTVPAEATIVQIGLDGVMVPMEGEHCDPRGREPKGDPDPPRYERKYGVVTAGGPAATDDKEGVGWHEASVGTLAFYDAEGNRLSTVYLGRMPEEKKETLGNMLCDEALHALSARPDLTPVMASDGAHGQWDTLAAIVQQMPEAARARAVWLLDFHHAAGYLQDACDAIDGKETPKAQVRRHQLAETLKAYSDGTERVLQSLRHYRRIAIREADRDELDSVIGFFNNNRYRTNYKEALDANLPIATGPTEAAAKSLVGVRMKRSGARFSQHGGQTVLTLRASLKSKRFDTLFGLIAKSYKSTVTRRAA
jgi:hypothetical protein